MADTPLVRENLVAGLEADLIGPYDAEPEAADELLPLPPSRWYLTGFIAPQTARENDDPTDDDELGAGSDEDEEETAGSEPEPKQRRRLPASMGLSVLLPQSEGADAVEVTVTYADYSLEEATDEATGRTRRQWRRHPEDRAVVTVPLDEVTVGDGVEVPDSGGLRLAGKLGQADAPGVPAGTRALSLFLINARPIGERGRWDEAFAFQVRMEVAFERGFLARPNVKGDGSNEWDDRVADLQFRDRFEYAVGHGVSVRVLDSEKPVRRVATTWIPRAEVRRVVTHEAEGVTTAMEDLAALDDPAALRAALVPLVDAYGKWIVEQRTIDPGTVPRRETRDLLMDKADRAKARILDGIELLAEDSEAFESFRLANRAMATAARQRNPERYEGGQRPSWRLFQLAFVLLNLRGVADERHADRDTVELIFFPTGGGKTEAYLGLIAFALTLRRLRGRERPDAGLGVAVILRYTLRLLTLDQLGRAATLICALEMIRKEMPERLGEVRFAVGLWVGKSATDNTMRDVAKSITEYKNSASKKAASPFPITNCPWCGEALTRDSLTLAPNRTKPTDVVVGCVNWRCDFAASNNREGLPVVFVDEQVYRELPSFIVATVDKFAMMPWRGETGMLFGRAHAREGRAFFGPLSVKPATAIALPDGLPPPELVVQDELHLISGPLGTMVGLYETAIEALCAREVEEGVRVRPKIVASTATVRRAQEQIRALFGRDEMAVFPPSGIDDSETFFAKVDSESPGRLYIGVAATGRAMKAILLRTYVGLMGGAAKAYDPKGTGDQPADGYMTVAGYFNSLRELGGMRRLVEDEVRTRCAQLEERKPLEAPTPHRWFKNRNVQMEPVELTSREHTSRIAESKARLAKPYADKERVDVLLASNMISVGVDIDRLGLMVVAGQPKTTSEYIQASSRVGRQTKWPGLVVTCFNAHKPRDRSHYERFAVYHESFYRHVEAQSLTPFSGPALERGLAGTLVAMARLLQPVMTPARSAMMIAQHRAVAEAAVRIIAERGGRQPGVVGEEYDTIVESLTDRGQNLLDAWERLVLEAQQEAASRRAYSPFDLDRTAGKPLLHTVLDQEDHDLGGDEAKFTAPTSMRDVERTVHLWLERRQLGGRS